MLSNGTNVITIVLEALILGGVGLLFAVIKWGASTTIARLSAIEQHLGTLNGRTGRLETWRDGHEAQADERVGLWRDEMGMVQRRIERLEENHLGGT